MGQVHTFSVQLSFQSTGPWDKYLLYIFSPVFFPDHRSLGQVHTFSVQSSFQSTGPWDSYIHFQSSRLSSPPVLGTATYIFSQVFLPVHWSLRDKYIHFQFSRISRPPVLGTSTYIFSPVVFPVHRSLGQVHTVIVHRPLVLTFPVHHSWGQVHTFPVQPSILFCKWCYAMGASVTHNITCQCSSRHRPPVLSLFC
jgi:hypothetical protein